MQNKQLGLVFVVVVALLPVFFTVGFFLGRNTGQTTPSENQTVPAEESQALSGKMFLQVSAVSQENAEALRKALVRSGFEVRLLPVPEENLVRVLVGPVRERQELNSTREALKAIGFESFPRRYD